jgi:hypothetical protein
MNRYRKKHGWWGNVLANGREYGFGVAAIWISAIIATYNLKT